MFNIFNTFNDVDIAKAKEAGMYLRNIEALETIRRTLSDSDLYRIRFVRQASDGTYVDAEREFDGLGRYVAIARESFDKAIRDDISLYERRIEEL